MLEPIVVIPARGGSKRIPGKNTRKLAGVPVLARTISVARHSGVGDSIYVSTDSTEIADLAHSLGAFVIERPAELADDHTPLLPVMNHAIAHLSQAGLIAPETPIACLYATAVTLDPTDFFQALQQLLNSKLGLPASMVTGVVEYPHPIERALRLGTNSELEAVSPRFASTRTQDLLAHYFDAGAFIWGFESGWADPTPVLTRATGYILPPWRSVDLDTESDWSRAELVISELDRVKR